MPSNSKKTILFLGLFLGLFLAAFLWLAGCSGSKHPELKRVSGTVLFDGEPVADALVAFYNEASARPATGRTDAQGKFHLTTFDDNDGALPGEHVVVVTKTDSEDETGTDVSLSMDEALVAPRPKKSKVKQLLPTRYGTPDTSPLRVNVSADKTNEPTISLSP